LDKKIEKNYDSSNGIPFPHWWIEVDKKIIVNEKDEKTGKISYNGVVFNEMKGAYSSPDGVLETRVIDMAELA
jgi:hypothetical protein